MLNNRTIIVVFTTEVCLRRVTPDLLALSVPARSRDRTALKTDIQHEDKSGAPSQASKEEARVCAYRQQQQYV